MPVPEFAPPDPPCIVARCDGSRAPLSRVAHPAYRRPACPLVVVPERAVTRMAA